MDKIFKKLKNKCSFLCVLIIKEVSLRRFRYLDVRKTISFNFLDERNYKKCSVA